MRDLWPSGSFADVFQTRDPWAGKDIEDRYGLVSYMANSALMTEAELPSLGMGGRQFLAIFDPKESQRVDSAAAHRASRRRGWPAAPSWLVHDTAGYHLTEKRVLAQVGISVEEAQALVSKTQDNTMSEGPRNNDR